MYIACFASQNLMFKPHVRLLNYNVTILLKSLSFKSISVTKSVLVLFPMFYNAHQLEKAFEFDTMQSIWLPSWISKMVLRNTYNVTDHVQS